MGLAFIAPMIPTLVEIPPEDSYSIHEIKYDGYRTQLIVERGAAMNLRPHPTLYLTVTPPAKGSGERAPTMSARTRTSMAAIPGQP